MGHYSIKDLEQLSGIKAHTIRIWEKRYAIINPKRTDTNIRYYSDQDLKKILNVSLLNTGGLKISKIAKLDIDELNEHVNELSASDEQLTKNREIDELVVGMIELNEPKFQHIISSATVKYGFEECMTGIIYPFLTKIGVLWQTGNINPAQEHFISNLVRQKIVAAIDQLPIITSSSAPLAILFLPENELHELGLLFASYLARKTGYRTIYLGQHLPYNDLLKVKEIYDAPKVIVTYAITPMKKNQMQNFLNKLSSDFSSSSILLSANTANLADIETAKNTYLVNSIDELITQLSDLQ